ncbi:hypothetical protein M758_5G168000, partial [Ceratodon purpureus]
PLIEPISFKLETAIYLQTPGSHFDIDHLGQNLLRFRSAKATHLVEHWSTIDHVIDGYGEFGRRWLVWR